MNFLEDELSGSLKTEKMLMEFQLQQRCMHAKRTKTTSEIKRP